MILGWRCWHLVRDAHGQPVLASVVRRYLWWGPVVWDPVAPDETYEPKKGQPWVSSGFHFFRDRETTVETIAGYHDLHVQFVIGACELYGHVVEHEIGYRAQGAVFDRIQLPPLHPSLGLLPDVRDRLERRYQCDVEYWPEWDSGPLRLVKRKVETGVG